MQLVCIICISATLVITSWSSVCFGAAARTPIPLAANNLQSTAAVFIKRTNIFESSNSEKTHSNDKQLKEELFALSKDNTKVTPLHILNGEQQNHRNLSSSGKLSSSSSGKNFSIGVDNGASVESAASNDFAVDNGINVPSIVDINKSNLISSNDSANPEKKEEQNFQGLAEKYRSTSVQNATRNLPKVMDPSFKTIAAISRRANRKHRNQNNHDRIKRSSLSRNNIGDEKYLRNVIDVEKAEFEYRRPWRISAPKIFSLMEETKYNSEKDYPKYHGQEGIISTPENQVDSRNYIPNKSSLEDQYHKQTSSYHHPISSPFVSDDSLPVKSISSSNLDSTEDISSSSSKRFQSHQNSKVFFKPHKKSDHQKLHQQHNHHHNNALKESDFKNIPVVQSSKLSSSSSLSVNDITYGTKGQSYNNPVDPIFASSNQQFIQKTDDAPMAQSAVEEPLVLASQQVRLTPHKVGQREQLPAATSNIIESGKSLVRNIMKRRSKTGRYDVPQVGK